LYHLEVSSRGLSDIHLTDDPISFSIKINNPPYLNGIIVAKKTNVTTGLMLLIQT
jgi:hypothetical protein